LDNTKQVLEELLDETLLDEKKHKEILQLKVKERLDELLLEYVSKC
jgi:hypothetical protein